MPMRASSRLSRPSSGFATAFMDSPAGKVQPFVARGPAAAMQRFPLLLTRRVFQQRSRSVGIISVIAIAKFRPHVVGNGVVRHLGPPLVEHQSANSALLLQQRQELGKTTLPSIQLALRALDFVQLPRY